MKIISTFYFLFFFFPLLASCLEEEIYIVYFGEHKGDKALHEIEDHHLSYLINVKENEDRARDSLIYSYKHAVNGFSAVLTPDEASKLSELEEVVSVFKSRSRQLQTTGSWNFVGLGEGPAYNSNNQESFGKDLLKKAGYGQEVIVGVIDNGVWPESKSFRDQGMGPVPKRWKGICQTGIAFNSSNCNRKIIGARYFAKGFLRRHKKINATEDFLSPRDAEGHGTHTASTVAGRRVRNVASIGGYARGTVSGGASLARLAIYKACWAIPNQPKDEGNDCPEEDLLDAIDHAVADGVDVLSISIGARDSTYTKDSIAIGSLHAVRHNIVVAVSAGNDGPEPSSLSNTAPWIITVAASSIDREFKRSVLLGNGMEVEGYSTAPYELRQKYPLVHARNVVVPGIRANVSGFCEPNSLSPEMVKGKVVFCLVGETSASFRQGLEVKRAGGFGMILGSTLPNQIDYDTDMLPATLLLAKESARVLQYISTTENPLAIIEPPRTVFRERPAPMIVDYSSVGPNNVDPHILKPDITAPGSYILAAWTGASSPTGTYEDNRRVKYNFISGTSMACPHVAAAAVLLKAMHPDWSNAAIRSALMTTAWTKNDRNQPIRDESGAIATPFRFGSGHFMPVKAADPGLVYDASYNDYINYLCGLGIKKMHSRLKCPKQVPLSRNLNYPSIAIPKLNGTVTIKRTVTYVGLGNSSSVYSFTAQPPIGTSVKAFPSVLSFDHIVQKQSFTIKVKRQRDELSNTQTGYVFGWYTWTDAHHIVKSPMAVSFA